MLYANSQKQSLAYHSLAVAQIAFQIFHDLDISEDDYERSPLETFSSRKKIADQIFFAGFFHDLGKADKNFQQFLSQNTTTEFAGDSSSYIYPIDGVHFEEQSSKKEKEHKFSFLMYPRHNEISWACSRFFLEYKDYVSSLYTIYFHHAKILRDQEWGKQDILDKTFVDEHDLKQTLTVFFEEVKDALTVVQIAPEFKEKIENFSKKIPHISLNGENLAVPKFLYSITTID